MALVGPAGAGIIGTVMGPFQPGRAPLRARVFNSGMFAIMGVVGGSRLHRPPAGVLGGDARREHRGRSCATSAFPFVFADVVQFAVNLVLIAIVVRLASGLSMRDPGRAAPRARRARRTSATASSRSSWSCSGGRRGWARPACFLILPPLLVAQWAYGQYAEEVKGHERALDVLVAAVEAKAPHLVGTAGGWPS